jgi:hypothetical protein
VQGAVPESWTDRLGGMGIVSVTSAATMLEGRLPDQTALNGVLDTLYQLRLPLLEVSCLPHGRPVVGTSHKDKKMKRNKVKIRLNAFVIALLAVIVCISGFARAAEQPSPKLTLISNVDIFDGQTETLHKNMHVLVKDNLIETVSNEPLAVIQTDNVYRLAKKLKLKTAWGTDTLFDPELAKKQGKLVAKMQRWYAPHEILKMVTHDNAQLLKLSGPRDPYPGRLGVVEEGAYADLILVDGNPLENLDLVADAEKNFVVIMKDGKIYKNAL